jgi:hypothetical protein
MNRSRISETSPLGNARGVSVVVVVVIEFTIPAKGRDRNSGHENDVTAWVHPSGLRNQKPTDIGLIVPKVNRSSDYDDDNDNDNDNDCFCFVRKILTNRIL